jgi:hypothetical protein
MLNEIDAILDPNEKILWRGKPQYFAYILSACPAVLMGIFWSMFLVPFYWAVFTKKFPIFVWVVLGPHTAVALGLLTAPLWASLFYPYIEYAITTKRIIMKSGFFARNFETLDYALLTDISISIGPVGRLTTTGDILFMSGMGMFTEKTGKHKLQAIEQPYEVFKLLKQTYFDVKTDMQFPNQMRPMINPGYQTQYRP